MFVQRYVPRKKAKKGADKSKILMAGELFLLCISPEISILIVKLIQALVKATTTEPKPSHRNALCRISILGPFEKGQGPAQNAGLHKKCFPKIS
jgi:hypothetical protein